MLPEEAKARLLENGRRRDTVGLGGANPLAGVWRPVLPQIGGRRASPLGLPSRVGYYWPR